MMKQVNILVIGYGVVGSNLTVELNKLNPDIYDKFKPEVNTRKEKSKYDLAFICVDTPYISGEKVCDISSIHNALQENDAEVYVIKSTVLPGTTDQLSQQYGKRIVFSPEYYGGTQHCNNFEFNFTILGGQKDDCKRVIQILQKVYDGRHIFRMIDAKTAELAKYMENSWLAYKVSFCTQFHSLSKKIQCNYEELRELFVLDPRVNPSHTFVYDSTPYWDSHCLNKDVRAIAETYDASLLLDMIKFNEKQKSSSITE